MARDDELNFGVPKRLYHVQVFFPGHSKDPFDAFTLQRSNEQVRAFHVHEMNLQFFRFLAMKWPDRVRSQVWVTLFALRLGNSPGPGMAWGVSKLGDTFYWRSAEFGMPWRQAKGLQQSRESFVKEAFEGEKPFGQLCQEYRISRKTMVTEKCHPILRQSVT